MSGRKAMSRPLQGLPSPRQFWRDESGIETLEYALIPELILIAAAFAFAYFNPSLPDLPDSVTGGGRRGPGGGGHR